MTRSSLSLNPFFRSAPVEPRRRETPPPVLGALAHVVGQRRRQSRLVLESDLIRLKRARLGVTFFGTSIVVAPAGIFWSSPLSTPIGLSDWAFWARLQMGRSFTSVVQTFRFLLHCFCMSWKHRRSRSCLHTLKRVSTNLVRQHCI
jgi:hypothetical protein